MGAESRVARTLVDAEASDLVRSAQAFEAGKLAYIVGAASALGELSIHDERAAFHRWTDKLDTLPPMPALARAWIAFRQGWLVAEDNSTGERR